MTRFLLTFLFLGAVTIAHAQTDIETQLSKKIIQDRYVNFLTGKDYGPEIDEDGDIKFTYNERSYYITIDMNEKAFFRIARLANLKLDSEAEITKAKNICHEVTRDEKVAKVYWINGTVWTSSEIILSDPKEYLKVFDRVLELTERAYESFVEKWQAQN